MSIPRLTTLFFSFSAISALVISANYAEEVPKGTVTKYIFDQSEIFPGTSREYWVYVPKQYDGSKPACVYVNQDSVQFNAPAVFDALIAAKEMPVTIGIFVTHGKVKAPNDQALMRYNRSYEYDGLGDNYARFLLDEFLPHVEKEHKLLLSKDGNDRCIGGSSSGAIAAFTAAWERPDAFTRVFSAIGTYVGLRGGNEYPTLIRKYEPKPIRIFLEDGSNDLNIYGGDWWMANQAMDRSFIFAGYEVAHVWGDGGHNGKHGTEVFPEGMRFLWKDWPKPVQAGAGSPQLKEVLIPGENWELVGEGYKFTEGITVSPKGDVYFNDIPNNTTYKINAEGKPEVWKTETKRANGQGFLPDGRLVQVVMEAEQMMAFDSAGKGSVIADGFRGNDVVILANGAMYVTEPGWDGKSPSKIWYISPSGEKKVVDDKGLIFANGITVSPDQTLLYVADSRSHWVWSYQIQPDGMLKYKQQYYHLHVPDTAEYSGADGMRTDCDGRLYVATKMGIQFCDQAGRVNGIIPTPNGKCSNLCFGGRDFNVLYATCGEKVYKRKVKVIGAQSFSAPIKPAMPKL
jgi:gluconolactonase